MSVKKTEKKKKKIGVALGAGGARGFCHVGVLRALEEHGIKPDIVTGSSMGSVIGGTYAAGISLDVWDSLSRTVTNHFVMDLSIRLSAPGLFGGDRVKRLLDKNFGKMLIEECPVKFACTAVELRSGLLAVFKEGKLADAVRASMSVPMIYKPVSINGKMYMDGGVLRRLPIAEARDLGADMVIAVDAKGPLLPKDKDPRTFLDMVYRFWDVADWAITEPYINSADVLLTPKITKRDMDFKKNADVIRAGYDCAVAAMPEILAAL